ncbi:MAG: magnesium/cobalt transporter CorA [Anaerolineales bacterium]
MQRSFYRDANGAKAGDLSADGIRNAISAGTGCLWIDFAGEAADSVEPLLRDVFQFHPLAVDDALQETHIPKLDDWGEYTYINLHSVHLDNGEANQVTSREIDLFIGPNFVISYRAGPAPSIERVWQMVERDERILRRGPAFLLYTLTDELVADVMPVVATLDDRIDEVEDVIFDHPGPELIETIFDLKRAILHLRRILGPQREVLSRLARGDSSVVPPADRIYFRDVYDHLVRQFDMVEGLRDLITGALDTYLSVVSNRLNDVMKTLTIITTVFMPLSFLTGFFGMNFFGPAPSSPPWTTTGFLLGTLVVMVALPLAMTVWMRRRKWM